MSLTLTLMSAGRRYIGALAALGALALAVSCSIPDPVQEPACPNCQDVQCDTCDRTPCGTCDVPDSSCPTCQEIRCDYAKQPDIPDVTEELDILPELPDDVDVEEPDLPPQCEGEPDCPDYGICKDKVGAVCVNGEHKCIYAGIEGLEWGGELTCDGQDNDCDGLVDEGLVPPKGMCKEEGVCKGLVPVCTGAAGWNCNYDDLAAYEEVETLCDGLDNNCDGEVDEGLCASCEPGAVACAGPDTLEGEPNQFVTCQPDGNGWTLSDCPVPEDACMGPGECTRADEWRLNDYVTNSQTAPAVTRVGDELIVVWQSDNQDGGGQGIYFKTFTTTGDEGLPELRANIYTVGPQQSPAVTALGDGIFFVGWESDGQDSSSMGLFGRNYVLGAEWLAGSEFPLTLTVENAQTGLATVPLDTGDAALLWENQAADGKRIFGARIASDGWLMPQEEDLSAEGGVTDSHPAGVQTGANKMLLVWQRKIGLNFDVLMRGVSGLSGSWNPEQKKGAAAKPDDNETLPAVTRSGDSVFVGWVEELGNAGCYKRFSENPGQPGVYDLDTPSMSGCIQPTGGTFAALQLAGDGQGGVIAAWQETEGASNNLFVRHLDSDAQWGDVVDVEFGAEMPATDAFQLLYLGNGKTIIVWSKKEITQNGLDVFARFLSL